MGSRFSSLLLQDFIVFFLLPHNPKPNDTYFTGFWEQMPISGIIFLLTSNWHINDEWQAP